MKPKWKSSPSCFTDVQFSDKERADSVYLSLTVVNKSCLKCSSPCRPPPFAVLIAYVNSYLLSFPVKLGEAREERHAPWCCLDHTLWRALMHTNGERKKKREKSLECYISLTSTRRQNRVLDNPQTGCLKIRLEWTKVKLLIWSPCSIQMINESFGGPKGTKNKSSLLMTRD